MHVHHCHVHACVLQSVFCVLKVGAPAVVRSVSARKATLVLFVSAQNPATYVSTQKMATPWAHLHIYVLCFQLIFFMDTVQYPIHTHACKTNPKCVRTHVRTYVCCAHLKETHFHCIQNEVCSGNGVCECNVCECNDGFSGSYCERCGSDEVSVW